MPKISDYFLIGNLHTAALVNNQASIDWYCPGKFDNPAVFSRILDSEAGHFGLQNPHAYQIASQYLQNTAIVQHKIKGKEGDTTEVLIEDYMPPIPHPTATSQLLVRKVTNTSRKEDSESSARIKFEFAPRPDFGRQPQEERLKLHLPSQASVEENVDTNTKIINLEMKAGETCYLVLEYNEIAEFSHLTAETLAATAKDTEDFWKGWLTQGKFFAEREEMLMRSAITLKLLQYYPTGGIVAAPTLGLPEEEGGVRNWDYRYVWIRDATFTIYAFNILGYDEEAQKFFDYIELILEKSISEDETVFPMYTINGEVVPNEEHLENLAGYENSRPVRVGNGANKQLQLDVYGALLDAYYFVNKEDLSRLKNSQKYIEFLVEKLAAHWEKPDHGIWEVRGQTQNFTYSKVMCWVGADRAAKLSEELQLPKETIDKSIELAENIKTWIWENCYNEEQEILTQSANNSAVDATNLLFVLVHFLDKRDPRTDRIVQNTITALTQNDSFIFRYLNHDHDGLAGAEGAFLLCSFWMVSALARLQNTQRAEKIMQKLELYAHPHGLLPEEVDPATGKYLGNYPQAFSHLGYIMAARYLNKYVNIPS